MIKKYLLISLLGLTSVNAQTVNDFTFGPKQEKKGQQLDNIIAVVGNDVITRRELNAVSAKNRKAFLNQLIMRKLLLQEAKKRNITANKKTTTKESRKTRGRKDSKAKENLIISRLQQQIVRSLVKISDREVTDIVDKQLKNIKQKINLTDILIKVPQSSDPQALSQAQAKTQEVIKKLKTQSPESIARQYSDVSYNRLGWVDLGKLPSKFSSVLVDAGENRFLRPIVDNDGIHLLKVLGRKRQSKGKGIKVRAIPETRASHILIKKSKNAKKTINSIYKKLKQGANFSQLATTYSQDTGSGSTGGDLNWVRPGQMVPSFEAMMNKTKTGTYSRPFKTRFGYHIVKVNDRRKAKVSNRQALENNARKMIFQRHANEEWNLWLSQLRAESHIEIRK